MHTITSTPKNKVSYFWVTTKNELIWIKAKRQDVKKPPDWIVVISFFFRALSLSVAITMMWAELTVPSGKLPTSETDQLSRPVSDEKLFFLLQSDNLTKFPRRISDKLLRLPSKFNFREIYKNLPRGRKEPRGLQEVVASLRPLNFRYRRRKQRWLELEIIHFQEARPSRQWPRSLAASNGFNSRRKKCKRQKIWTGPWFNFEPAYEVKFSLS